ncbi:MAG TPA: pyrroline-5-carboxylate reductase [Thermoanaerobaculia bacterium]|nr:pyrroline-5-carboxylate reductase [Thermoanaerobaculia bacterium]
MQTRIAFVGSGVMAEVMIRGLLTQELASPDRVWAAGPRPERAEQLSRDYGVRGTTDTLEAVAGSDLIVLAIKPGTLGKVLRQIHDTVRPEQAVMSIVAGARTGAIGQALGRPAIVRCVPNLPCRVGRGLTVWTATPEVPEEARETVRILLRTLGREVFFADEAQVDRATAAYGTAPTLLAQLVKGLEDAAVYLGEPRGLAREMILEAILGTAGMMLDTGLSPTELTDQITSPGGTTSRALHALGEGRFSAVLTRAVRAAYERTLEIGDQLDGELGEDS